MVRLLDEALELLLGEASAAVNCLRQPPLLPRLQIRAQVDTKLPRIASPVTHRARSHDTATVRLRSWTSHGQLMDSVVAT